MDEEKSEYVPYDPASQDPTNWRNLTETPPSARYAIMVEEQGRVNLNALSLKLYFSAGKPEVGRFGVSYVLFYDTNGVLHQFMGFRVHIETVKPVDEARPEKEARFEVEVKPLTRQEPMIYKTIEPPRAEVTGDGHILFVDIAGIQRIIVNDKVHWYSIYSLREAGVSYNVAYNLKKEAP